MKNSLFAAGAAVLLAAVSVGGHVVGPAHAQTGNAPQGANVFKQRCAACHAVAGKGGKLGPDLTGVVGRRAGSTNYNYSAAMKGSKIVWNAKTLDAYLVAPTKAVPGTKMSVAVPSPQDRGAVIAYLGSTRK